MIMTEGRLYIGGELKVSSGERTFATINPANEEVICQVAQADRADVDDAVAAARAGFEAWSALDANERGRLLWKIAEAIEGDGDELARLDCIDSGKPIVDAREDVHAAVNMFRYFAGMADKIEGSTIPASNSKLVYTLREPYGVVAAITAWNYPLFNACAKIAPVLAAGNSCVLKPAEETPLTAIRLAQVIAAVEGVPTGLLNVINGPGETTGAMLVAHEGVNRITFTGSTQTGQDILKNVGNNTVKGLTLELGGKAPVIVCGDANLEAAANAITFSAFYNQGQTCTAATRVIVEESVHDALLERLVDQAKFVEVGDPASDDTILG
ncbi:MAG: aldehyde dehydrogenase, partial [Chloroflexia bacterium]|nr:aldehyde dehydrogenase [Chloroflexia bacterium]